MSTKAATKKEDASPKSNKSKKSQGSAAKPDVKTTSVEKKETGLFGSVLNMFSGTTAAQEDSTTKPAADTKKEEKKEEAPAKAAVDTKKEEKTEEKKADKDKKEGKGDKKKNDKNAGKKNDAKDKKDGKKEYKKKGEEDTKAKTNNKDKKKGDKPEKGAGKANKKDNAQGKGAKKGGKKNRFETGSCKWFDSQKGFGFITADDGGEEIFVHNSEIVAQGFRSLQEGERVQYESFLDNGRRKARNVTGPKGGPIKGDSNKGGKQNKGGFQQGFQGGFQQGKNGKGNGKGGKHQGPGKGGKNNGFQLAKRESQDSYVKNFQQGQAAGYPANHPFLMQWMAAAQAQAAWSNSWYNGSTWY